MFNTDDYIVDTIRQYDAKIKFSFVGNVGTAVVYTYNKVLPSLGINQDIKMTIEIGQRNLTTFEEHVNRLVRRLINEGLLQ